MAKIPPSPSTDPEPYERSSKPSAPDGWRPEPISVYQRNNNPPIPRYRPPHSQYNKTDEYQIPGLLSLVVSDLKKHGGDVYAFLEEYADEDDRQLLMFTLYQKFQEPGNLDHFQAWQTLIETHRLAKLSIVQAKILHELGEETEEQEGSRKKGRTGRPTADVTKLMIGRILADDTPHRGPGRPAAAKPAPPAPLAPQLTPEEEERKRQQDRILATLRNGQRPPQDTTTD